MSRRKQSCPKHREQESGLGEEQANMEASGPPPPSSGRGAGAPGDRRQRSTSSSLLATLVTTDESDDNEFAYAIAPQNRYCVDCEIQFNSYKTFKVHKQFYCSSRHANTRMSNGHAGSLKRKHQALELQNSNGNANCNDSIRFSSVGLAAVAAAAVSALPTTLPFVVSASHGPSSMSSGLEGDHVPQLQSSTNASPSLPPTALSSVALLNQPIYVAISTNPLILVPCSYNAATGGLNFPSASPGMVSFNGTTTGVDNQGPSSLSSPSSLSATNAAAAQAMAVKLMQLSSSNNESDFSPFEAHRTLSSSKSALVEGSSSGIGLNGGDLAPSGDGPLDLSCKQQGSTSAINCDADLDSCDVSISLMPRKQQTRRLSLSRHDINMDTTDDNHSHSSCSPPPPSLPPLSVAQNHSNHNSNSSTVLGGHHTSDILVKQGTYRCTDCKIVFYKQDNFLAHKALYCAARRTAETSSPSPEPAESDHQPSSSPDIAVDTKPPRLLTSSPPLGPLVPSASSSSSHHLRKSRSPSTRSNGTVTPPPTLSSPPHHIHSVQQQAQHPVFQFFCVACGIRFTSLDNLQAHQTYYCLKRTVVVPKPTGGSSDGGVGGGVDVIVGAVNGKGGGGAGDKARLDCTSATSGAPSKETTSNMNSSSSTPVTVQCFKCSICGYKGHTLRGMRTHVRIHQDKVQGASEESFIDCINETMVIRSKGGQGGQGSGRRRRSLDHHHLHHPATSSSSAGSTMQVTKSASLRCSSSQRCSDATSASCRSKSMSNNDTNYTESSENEEATLPATTTTTTAAATATTTTSASEVKCEQIIESSGIVTNGGGGEALHTCNFCFYSSSYKGNVVRHIKLVHKDIANSSNQRGFCREASGVEIVLKRSPSSVEECSQMSSDNALTRDETGPDLASYATDATGDDGCSSRGSRLACLSSPPVSSSLPSSATVLAATLSSLQAAINSANAAAAAAAASSSSGATESGPDGQECPRLGSAEGGGGGDSSKKIGPKYCHSCDISFKYLSSFVAHKKYYCSSHLSEAMLIGSSDGETAQQREQETN